MDSQKRKEQDCPSVQYLQYCYQWETVMKSKVISDQTDLVFELQRTPSAQLLFVTAESR